MKFPFSNNAQILRVLHEDLHAAFREDPGGEKHLKACDTFRNRYEELAFPGGLQNGLDKLAQNDPAITEQAICFLENDPWFFRSGYAKATMLRRLKHVKLSDRQKNRLIKVIYRLLDNEIRTGFAGYAALAGVIFNPTLIDDVKARTKYSDPIISSRAKHLIHIWKSRKVIS